MSCLYSRTPFLMERWLFLYRRGPSIPMLWTGFFLTWSMWGDQVSRVSRVWRLQVLQSKCLRLANGAPWYVSNRQLHDDLGVLLFADHIRTLTASFDLRLADVGNPLLRQLSRYLSWPRVDPVAWSESRRRQGPAGQSRPSPAMSKSNKRIAFGAD